MDESCFISLMLGRANLSEAYHCERPVRWAFSKVTSGMLNLIVNVCIAFEGNYMILVEGFRYSTYTYVEASGVAFLLETLLTDVSQGLVYLSCHPKCYAFGMLVTNKVQVLFGACDLPPGRICTDRLFCHHHPSDEHH